MIIRKIKKLKRWLVKITTKSLKPENIKSCLLAANLDKGVDCYVTSSLSSFGNLANGPETLFLGLKFFFGEEATIVCPGHSNPNLLDHGKVDLREQNMNTGKFPSFLMSQKGSKRSSHPFASTIALGANAEFYCADHDAFPTICHSKSPVAKLYNNNCYLIGFGTEPTAMIHYHLIEERRIDFPFEVYDGGKNCTYIDIDGKVICRTVKRFSSPLNDYRIERPKGKFVREKFMERLRSSNRFVEFKIGKSRSWAIRSSDLYDIIENFLDDGQTIYDVNALKRDA